MIHYQIKESEHSSNIDNSQSTKKEQIIRVREAANTKQEKYREIMSNTRLNI